MYISHKTLHLAARGDLDQVVALLDGEPGLLNAASEGHNRTLLWEAARSGRLDVVRYLVEIGADVNIPGRYRHETFVLTKPYCIAVTKKRAHVAAYLLDRGTTIDIYTAAYLGEMDVLRQWTEHCPDLAHQQQPEETLWPVTVLHHAAAGEQIKAARYLLGAGAEVVPHARLLFDISCRRARMDLVELFVGAGADPRQADAFSVVHSDSPEIVDFFFSRGCPVEGMLPYVSRGDKGEHSEWVAALLRYGADLDERDNQGRTALHNAARAGFARVIEVLLAAGAQVNPRMASGETPLALAVRRKRHEAAELLRQHGGEV